MRKNRNIFSMTIISMLIAILIIQTFVPILGYIPLGPFDVTIVHITVILTAVLFGSKMGLTVGTIWGSVSMIRAYTQRTPFNIVFLTPLISVVPWMLVVWISGLIFQWIKNHFPERLSYTVIALVGTLLNTILVLGGIYIFAAESYAYGLGVPESTLLSILGTVVATNG